MWQIASGSEGRDYSKYFFRYGMAFVGGEENIRRMEHVDVGNIIVLKTGKKILAVGRVTQVGGEDLEWLKDFDGWILPAYCYVHWKQPEQPIPMPSLAQAAIARVYDQDVINTANNIWNDGFEVPTSPEPAPTALVEDSDILECLIEAGLRPSSEDELTKAIRRIRLLATYYYNNRWGKIGEHETRTFLVIPLLLALGWSEKKLKIELPAGGRNRIDIACFRTDHDEINEDCVAIIETKGFSSGLDDARDQAVTYTEGFESCEAVITTNGYCYKVTSVRNISQINSIG